MSKFIFTVEQEALEGVKRIVKKAALDFEKVSGSVPQIQESLPVNSNNEKSVVFATIGYSPITEKLSEEGKIDLSVIAGKKEVYQIKFIDNTLYIIGSDKRGTIYGIFALSEYIGVSPLHFWGDVEPGKKDIIEINKDIETISKEPSIKYRGFFINDEWPCFGNWTFSRFGGFTAEMYEHVFELLLRLKGNYLWPAMWTSSFPLDGPGHLNEELADIYGVVMGASHHEPCLRASEEWALVRGEKSGYGNEWNYYTNKNGLIKYWEDGLKRSGKYEKLITIGMRGEYDSSMLGDDSALKDNIDILKDIIKNQRELIKKHVNPDITKVPQVLAIYKEVEEYFHGNEKTEGLKSWSELNDVIFLLCEDNFGFMRTLPPPETRERSGGYGMYYHFDYHGGPISYEWMPSTSFERTWEQMCMAKDYGIKDLWVVNVGDLKFNEVQLFYFMELAYDFEKWGTASINSIDDFTSLWLGKTFPGVDTPLRAKMAEVLHGYIRMNAARRPEALNADIYHPCHYLEADRMLFLAENINTKNEEIYTALNGNGKDAYYSLIYFPAKMSVNLLRMHIYAGKNRHFAEQGKTIANDYAVMVTECLEKDRALNGEFSQFRESKWKGMELEQHIGFRNWNEDNYRNPLRIQVEPAYKPRLTVSRKDKKNIYTKTYGNPMLMKINDFLYAGNSTVIIEIANDGIGSLDYTIEPDKNCTWLEFSSLHGTVKLQEEVTIRCNKEKLSSNEVNNTRFLIKDKETIVAVEVKARNIDTKNLPPMTFLENNGLFVMESNHYSNKKDTKKGSFTELKNYGRSGCGMKVFPTTVDFNEKEEKPSLTYSFLIEEIGDYSAEIWTTPTNPVYDKRPLRLILKTKSTEQVITTVPSDFKAGNNSDKRWQRGVLDNIRVTKTSLTFEKGLQQITISPLEAGLILERILIYKDNALLESYLGPQESYHT